jgi:hypothetical protein
MNNIKVKITNHSTYKKCVVIKREELMKLSSNPKVRKLNVIDFNSEEPLTPKSDFWNNSVSECYHYNYKKVS